MSTFLIDKNIVGALSMFAYSHHYGPNITLRIVSLIIDVTENLVLNAKFRFEKINAPYFLATLQKGVYFRKYGNYSGACLFRMTNLHELSLGDPISVDDNSGGLLLCGLVKLDEPFPNCIQ